MKTTATKAFEHGRAVRLGLIYDALAALVRDGNIDDSTGRGRISHLIDAYGDKDVRWVLGVIRDDIAAGRSAS